MKNWKTTWSGIGSKSMFFLAVVAAAPYQLPTIGDVFPPKLKGYILFGGAVAGLILGCINAVMQKDK